MTTTFRPYQTANEQQEGQVGLSNQSENHDPQLCVCIRNYNGYIWFPIADISASNWMKYRDRIAINLEQFKQLSQKDAKELTALRAKRHFLSESRAMIGELFEHIIHMTPENKRAFVKKYKNTYIGRHICEICLTHSDKATYRCIHYDCGGMCKSCHEKLGDHCSVCDRDQKIACPICQEEKGIDELGSSESCFHKVCWECIGRAYIANAPITKCPQCRATFTKPPPRPAVSEDDEALAIELQALVDNEPLEDLDDEGETNSLPDLVPLELPSNVHTPIALAHPIQRLQSPAPPPGAPPPDAQHDPSWNPADAAQVASNIQTSATGEGTHIHFEFPTTPMAGFPNPFRTPPRLNRMSRAAARTRGADFIEDIINSPTTDE